MRRKYSAHIKSVLHFDYPYYAEDGDGLADEAGLFSWARKGDAKLCGSQIPADEIIQGTPKFGYRCLHTASAGSYIEGTGAALSADKLEASLWVRPAAASAGNILVLGNSFTMTLDATLHINVTSSLLSHTVTSTNPLKTGTWHHIKLDLGGGSCALYIDGENEGSSVLGGSIPSFSSIKLGGFNGMTDEFVLRDYFTLYTPSQPEQGECSLQELGGWGTGALGDAVISSNCVMNTAGAFSKANSSVNYTLKSISTGKWGTFNAGDEVMILSRSTGEYCFRTAEEFKSSKLTLSKAPDFTPDANTIFVQVPNFQTLTVNEKITATPPPQGIMAFRVKGNCTIRGSLITSGRGTKRTDFERMRHSLLPEKFLYGEGGGIFITCGGKFKVYSGARLGASWDGTKGPGLPASKSAGGCGGAGYGGAGGSAPDSAEALGGKGGVGGGGGAGDAKLIGGDAGQTGTTGGHSSGTAGQWPGGTQGKDAGGNAPNQSGERETGGGGAGGSGGKLGKPIRGGYCGTCILVAADTLSVDASAVSTGGEGGRIVDPSASGGGGTGFCYFAAKAVEG